MSRGRISPRFDVNHAILNLKLSIDAQDAAAGDDEAVGFKHVGRDDDVGDTGFIFQ